MNILAISLGGVVADVLDCNIVVIEFEFQSRYNIHLRKIGIALSQKLWDE